GFGAASAAGTAGRIVGLLSRMLYRRDETMRGTVNPLERCVNRGDRGVRTVIRCSGCSEDRGFSRATTIRVRRTFAALSACSVVSTMLAMLVLPVAAQRRDFPPRPPGDPAAIERGRALYSVNCTFCHGPDTRGGDGGPSLLRAAIVLDDQNGELIAP